MKSLILSLVSFLFFSYVQGQSDLPTGISWNEIYGSINNDYPENLGEKESGNFYASGEKQSGSPQSVPNGFYAVTFDSLGQKVEGDGSKVLNSTSLPHSFPNKFGGTTYLGEVSTYRPPYHQFASVVARDSAGNYAGGRSFDTGHKRLSFVDEASSIYKLTSGNIFVTIQCSDRDTSHDYHKGPGAIWVILLDAEYNIIWDKTFGGNGFESLVSSKLINDNTVKIIARTNSTDKDLAGLNPEEKIVFWEFTVDEQQNLTQKRIVEDLPYFYSQSRSTFKELEDGHFLVYGSIESDNSEIPGHHNLPGADGFDAFIAKTDDQSEKLEIKQLLGGSNSDKMVELENLPNGNWVAGIVTTSEDGIMKDLPKDNALLVLMDSVFNILDANTYGYPDKSEDLKGIHPLKDGSYILMIRNTSHDWPHYQSTWHESRPDDYWILRTNTPGTTTSIDNLTTSENWNLFPNPVTTQTLHSSRLGTYILLSVNGKVLGTFENTTMLLLPKLKRGIYFVREVSSGLAKKITVE